MTLCTYIRFTYYFSELADSCAGGSQGEVSSGVTQSQSAFTQELTVSSTVEAGK